MDGSVKYMTLAGLFDNQKRKTIRDDYGDYHKEVEHEEVVNYGKN